jgi:hypothetical protein
VAVRSEHNSYRGVNAHLHSLWQARGGWHEFHSLYLANLYTQIKPRLLEMGYTAALESSVQVRRLDDEYTEQIATELHGFTSDQFAAPLTILDETVQSLEVANVGIDLPIARWDVLRYRIPRAAW